MVQWVIVYVTYLIMQKNVLCYLNTVLIVIEKGISLKKMYVMLSTFLGLV